tara:strand:+ start:582 stop:890 length:309 start_codon:yes stop_codon:yes gene_type:complete
MISCENDVLLETDEELLVHCCKMNNTHMYYRCPYCWTIPSSGRVISSPYKKNGERYKSAVPTLHYHGNPQFKMGSYHKISHCEFNKKCVRIVVDENTKKELV